MKKFSYLLFPFAALLNSFSMTALLLVIGLSGRGEIVADIAIVQGASLALFFAFSANARNIVLATSQRRGDEAASGLMFARLLLLVPLGVATYFLSVYVGGAVAALTITLTVRRACEWVGEIALARQEVSGNVGVAMRVVVAEVVSLAICVAGTLLSGIDLSMSAIPWALVPLLPIFGQKFSRRTKNFNFHELLPHFGSTTIIGASVFVFRLSVTLLTGKAFAGVLFTAFAIGGLIPTIIGQVLAPTLMRRYEKYRLPWQLAAVPAGMLIIGSLIVLAALRYPQEITNATFTPIFWITLGFSIAGGAVMTIAMVLRARLLHDQRSEGVFGPDFMANVLIAIGVPFIFYVFGPKSLAMLYFASAVLNLLFLVGTRGRLQLDGKSQSAFLLVMVVLLIFPVFFQMRGGLFSDLAFVFDAQGDITRLPLPVSLVAMFVGIAAIANYEQASRSLSTLFFSALLFVMTSLVVAKGAPQQEGAKLILLAQFLLPMFGLVFGEMYGSIEGKGRVVLWAASGVMLLVLPAQLAFSWSNGYTLLSPHVFVFSIYQHLQYFPMVVSALAIFTLISFWDASAIERRLVYFFMPVVAIYIFSTHSIAAMAGLALALGGFSLKHVLDGVAKKQALLLVLAVAVMLVAFGVARESGWLAKQLIPAGQVIDQETWQGKLSPSPQTDNSLVHRGVTERYEHWRFFSAGVTQSLESFVVGHRIPPDREKHPSAHNYWLDTAYNFGVLSLAPLLALLVWTLLALWSVRKKLAQDSALFGLALAVLYLLLFENMLKVGMRQPYSGIITFFLWGLLIARLRNLRASAEEERQLS